MPPLPPDLLAIIVFSRRCRVSLVREQVLSDMEAMLLVSVGGELLVSVAVRRAEFVEEVGGDMLFTCTVYIRYIS
jgi:hypothetical protein